MVIARRRRARRGQHGADRGGDAGRPGRAPDRLLAPTPSCASRRRGRAVAGGQARRVGRARHAVLRRRRRGAGRARVCSLGRAYFAEHDEVEIEDAPTLVAPVLVAVDGSARGIEVTAAAARLAAERGAGVEVAARARDRRRRRGGRRPREPRDGRDRARPAALVAAARGGRSPPGGEVRAHLRRPRGRRRRRGRRTPVVRGAVAAVATAGLRRARQVRGRSCCEAYAVRGGSALASRPGRSVVTPRSASIKESSAAAGRTRRPDGFLRLRTERAVAKVIAFANQKGGVAKTTTTLNLAAAFAEEGHRVLCIDMDPQGNLTMSQGIDPETLDQSMFDVLVHDHADPRGDLPLRDRRRGGLDRPRRRRDRDVGEDRPRALAGQGAARCRGRLRLHLHRYAAVSGTLDGERTDRGRQGDRPRAVRVSLDARARSSSRTRFP